LRRGKVPLFLAVEMKKYLFSHSFVAEDGEDRSSYMEPTMDNKNVRNDKRNHRKHQRQDFPYAVVEYVLNSDTTNGIFIGFTLNVSESGLCLYTPKLLNVAQEIVIKGNCLVSSQIATVRWIEKYDDFFYKIGLSFNNVHY
jgi:hypothetical protein